jgi:hypothetical protein
MIFQQKKVVSSSVKNDKKSGGNFGGISLFDTRNYLIKSAPWSFNVSLSGCANLSFVTIRQSP